MAKKKKKHVDCDCIFCRSVCPECGSRDIEVRFVKEYRYSNDVEDRIDIESFGSDTGIQCLACGWEVDPEQEDPRTKPLNATLNRTLNLPHSMDIPIDEDMKIKATEYRIVSAKMVKKATPKGKKKA